MKNLVAIFGLSILMLFGTLSAQDVISLNPPDMNRGITVMKALEVRASASEFNGTNISLQDLGDLLWAANGVNRPEKDKRTAPSAINAQDIDLYVCTREGIFKYDAFRHALENVATGDFRAEVAGRQEGFKEAPLFCILVSDTSRFSRGNGPQRERWAAMDAGIVSQNISIFCAANKMDTRPRATMNQEKLREVMKLKETQLLMLNHPVGYQE